MVRAHRLRKRYRPRFEPIAEETAWQLGLANLIAFLLTLSPGDRDPPASESLASDILWSTSLFSLFSIFASRPSPRRSVLLHLGGPPYPPSASLLGPLDILTLVRRIGLSTKGLYAAILSCTERGSISVWSDPSYELRAILAAGSARRAVFLTLLFARPKITRLRRRITLARRRLSLRLSRAIDALAAMATAMLHPRGATPSTSRRVLMYLLAGFVIALILVSSLSKSSGPRTLGGSPVAYADVPIHKVNVEADTLKGGAIMPKLGNETLKAELGRASWKLFHTTMARFPDKPTEDEQTALFSYIHLFARLYPCGECTGHFREILQRFPPQVRTRSSAAVWACSVHNQVNRSLGKPDFDCSKIGDFYKCGCADEDENSKDGEGSSDGGSSTTGEGETKRDEKKELSPEEEMAAQKNMWPPDLKWHYEGETQGG